IAARATPVQQQRYLAPICRGEHLTTLALSEPGTGVHFYFPRASITREGGRLVLNGTKSFVTNGGHADSYVVSAVTAGRDVAPGVFSCLVLPADAPGASWGGAWAGFGMRGNSARTLELREVALDEDHLLGREGDELWYVFNVVAPYFLVAMSGTYLGLATAALDQVREHLAGRSYAHSGASLAESNVLQHRLGTLWGHVEATRRLLYHAAMSGDAGDELALVALCSAKAEVADCAVRVCNEAMTLMGGAAYREDGTVARLLRDARASHVMAPTTDVLRTWAGRALLGLPLLAE
ncbi:MAG: acyl-CoA dehydrogenase family protein, partial [Myxococcales bacterium]